MHLAGSVGKLILSPEHVAESTRQPFDTALWSPHRHLLRRLVDRLHPSCRLYDALWAELAAEFSEERLIVLLMRTGQDHPIPMRVNGLQMAPEPLAPRFPR